MRILPITLLALLLAALSSPSPAQDDPAKATIKVGGKPLDLTALDELRREVEEALEGVPADPKNPRWQKKAVLDQARAMLERIRESDSEKTKIQGAIRKDRESITTARLEAEDPAVEERLSEQDLKALVAAAEKTRQEVTAAGGDLKVKEKAVESRQQWFDGVSKEFGELQKERERLRAALDDPKVQPEDRPIREAELDVIELKIGLLELRRDYHPVLSSLDALERDRARVRVDLADARRARAEAILQKARKTREAQLKAEQEAAREQAVQKRREAERARDPAARGVAQLEALIADLRTADAHETGLASKVEQIHQDAQARLERIQQRQDSIISPRSSDLDALRGDYLVDELKRAEARRREIDEWRRGAERFLHWARREAVRARDNVIRLRERIKDEENRSILSATEGEPTPERRFGTGAAPPDSPESHYARWLEAVRNFERGKEESREGFLLDIALLRTDFDRASQDLSKVIDQRIKRLEKIETLSVEAMERAREAQRLLIVRQEILEDRSFWLRLDSPLSAEALGAARGEIQKLVSDLPELPARSGSRLRGRAFSLLDALAALCLAAALLWGLLRRRATANAAPAPEATRREETRILGALGRVLLGTVPALLVIGAATLFFRGLLPADPLQCVFMTALLVVVGWRIAVRSIASFAATNAVQSDPKSEVEATVLTRKTAVAQVKELARLAFVGFVILLPAIGFFRRMEAPHLEALGRILLTAFILWIAARLWFRRAALRAVLGIRAESAVTRVLHGLIRMCWPALVLFLAAVLVLDLLGYRNASNQFVVRSVLFIGVLVAANLFHLILLAVIRSRLGSPAVEEETDDPDYDFDTQRRKVLARLITLLLVVSTAAGTWYGLSLVLGISMDRWMKWGEFELVSGAENRPGTTLAHLVKAIGYAGLGLLIGGLVRQFLQLGLKRGKLLRRGARYAVSTLTSYTVIAVGFVLGFRALGIYLENLGWFLAPAGVAVGFGLTQILSNFVSGIILFLERPVQVGDIITVGDIEGDVTRISIRSTVIRTRDGVSIILPNRKLIEEDVVNWSHADPRTRMRVAVSVAYGSDVPLVKRVLLEVAERDARILRRPRPEIQFKGFGESELQFVLLIWLATPDISMRRRVLSDVNSAIDAAFRRAGITIPFPQRDLHLKTVPEPRDGRDAEAPAPPAGEDAIPSALRAEGR